MRNPNPIDDVAHLIRCYAKNMGHRCEVCDDIIRRERIERALRQEVAP